MRLSRRERIRISELSAATGVPVATIKYYLREGLLPPGEATAPTQAVYGDQHVRRLRLVRALREVGGLGIEPIRAVVAALEDPTRSRHAVLGAAHRALVPAGDPAPDAELADVDRLLGQLGWRVAPDAPDRSVLARVLASLRALGSEVDADALVPYARAVDALAAMEVQGLPGDPDAAVERAVVGTVAYGTALLALRRLAQEHHSASVAGGC